MAEDNPLYIEDRSDMIAWLAGTMEAMRKLETIQTRCYFCGSVMLFPLTAREEDVKMFKDIMNCAFDVMDRYGITVNLLAEIRSQCLIGAAMKREGNSNESSN